MKNIDNLDFLSPRAAFARRPLIIALTAMPGRTVAVRVGQLILLLSLASARAKLLLFRAKPVDSEILLLAFVLLY